MLFSDWLLTDPSHQCGPGDICERCVKRAQRPNTGDYGLGCNRTHLKDLTEYFVPGKRIISRYGFQI